MSDLAERRTRWRDAIAAPGTGRRLLLVEIADPDNPRPPLHPDREEERIEWAWEKYRRQSARLETVADDRVPYLDCLTGTEIFAAAFGCEVDYPDHSNPFAIPCVDSPEEADRLAVPSLDAPSLAGVLRIGAELARRAGPAAPLRLPDIQSPMDIAGIVWDKNDFFVSIVESPEAVRAFAAKTGRLLTSFLDEWFARFGRLFVAHYPDYPMEQGLSLSEDEIGSVSPAVFRDHFLPELNSLSQRYGGIGIHCCAHAEHQWDGLAAVEGLRLLNLNQPEDVLSRAVERFAHTALLLPLPAPVVRPQPDAAWAQSWRAAFTEVGEANVVFAVAAGDEEQARAIADGFREALG